MKHLFVGAGLPANRIFPPVAALVRGHTPGQLLGASASPSARSYSYKFTLAAMCILFATNLFATTPDNDEQTDEKQETPQKVKPVDSSKLKTGTPAVTFTPSEKVGADSAVSFPVDI
jgi:hypothetical protein